MKYFKFKFLSLLFALAMAIPPAWGEETVTVCDGNVTTGYLPVYGYNFDHAQQNQMVYPVSELGDLPNGAFINSITFYPETALAFSGADVTFKIGNLSSATPYSTDGYGNATALDATGLSVVATVTPNSDNPWVITFDEPFEYTGGSLFIDVTSPGATYGTTSFTGKDLGSNYGYYAYGTYTKKAVSILPKMQIAYDAEAKPYAARVTPTSLDFGKLLPNAEAIMTITLKNTGANAFTPSISSLSTPFSTTYTPASLAPGTEVVIPIKYNPTEVGNYSSTFTIGAAESTEISAEVSLTGSCSNDITVEDGDVSQSYLPLFYPGYYTQKNQMIYPASDLTSLVGKQITGLTFYCNDALVFDGTYSVALGMTNQASYSGATPIEGLTTVVTNHTATAGVAEFAIAFDEPFTYTGDNLVIQMEVTDKGTTGYAASPFYGTEQSSNTAYYWYNASYGDYGYTRAFLPKVTFDYVDSGEVPTATVDKEALDFGNIVVNSTSTAQVVVLTNTSDVAFTPVLTFTDVFATTATPVEIGENGTLEIPVTFTPTEMTDYSGTLTISDGHGHKLATVMLTGTGIEQVLDYAVSVSPNGGEISFGTANPEEGESKTRTITITNTGLQPVTPSLSDLTAPFSTDYTPTEIASGESVTITITFAPTAEGNFTSEATLSFGNGIDNVSFTLTGKGGTIDENDHSALYDYTYDWVDANNQPRSSNLLETATEPEQIIAMLREIYTNTEIPGNLYRGYDVNGELEKDKNGNDWQVSYPAIGKLAQTYDNGSYSYQYSDAYGWNIPTSKDIQSATLGSYNYRYFDSYEYQPEQDGLTVIMMEMNDNPEGADQIAGFSSFATTDYASLRDMIGTLFKSARIITTYKETGNTTDKNAGTLFKIDADKLNRFFFLAKGRLRASDCSAQNPGEDWAANGDPSFRFRNGSERSGSWGDNFNMAPFYNMFEQFSPVNLSEGSASSDIYQEMVNMQSYPVEHDCQSIPFIALTSSITIDGVQYSYGHEFNMYGKDSQSDDCQDVRDMMFFVPKYRMMDHYVSPSYHSSSDRDVSDQDVFVNYHQNDSGATEKYAPTLGLYVIRQNEITGEKQADTDVYDLNLSWQSNLLDFLPGAEAQYELFRVTIDDSGNKSYTRVATLDPNQTTYVDHIEMQENGQEVTYVVQGQDITQFLSLQMSNEESYIIPGTDPSVIFTLSPKTSNYARFDPLTESNYYANELTVKNNVGTNIKGKYLGNGATFTFYRTSSYGSTIGDTVPVFVATSNGNGVLTITSQNQNRDGKYRNWINMTNPREIRYTVDASDNVTLEGFTLYDNFAESVADNAHPSLYIYEVAFEASQTIDGLEDNMAHSNQIGVFVHKTDMNVLGYTQEQIDADKDHALTTGVRNINEEVKYSSKTEILRYDVYRWKQGVENYGEIIDFDNSTFNATAHTLDESDVEPTGQAGNQGGSYTVKMDGVNSQGITIGQSQALPVTYLDNIVENEWGMYTYAPVVETFTSRSDYNTYGAPLQQTGVATIHNDVLYAEMSTRNADGTAGGSWEENGKKYTHYTVLLKMDTLNIPIDDTDRFKDYDLYKVRVWRQVESELLNEQKFDENKYPDRNRQERLENTVTIGGKTYGEFMMEELDYTKFSRETVLNEEQQDGNRLGASDVKTFYPDWSPGTQEVMATFGAQKLIETDGETGCIEELPMNFIVRAYYTRKANLNETLPTSLKANGDGLAADQKYYIAEYKFSYVLNSENPPYTSVNGVYQDKEVAGVTYYNMMGQQSGKPFDGVNIVVTRYNDGTTKTAKVIK